MNGENVGHEHPRTTERGHYRYFFYTKHHTPTSTGAAQWLPSLTDEV